MEDTKYNNLMEEITNVRKEVAQIDADLEQDRRDINQFKVEMENLKVEIKALREEIATQGQRLKGRMADVMEPAVNEVSKLTKAIKNKKKVVVNVKSIFPWFKKAR